MKHARPIHGFTLIELLLAMMIAAILSLALYSSMNTAIRARRTAQNAVDSIRAGTIALDLVCRDLESVVTPAPSDGTTQTLKGTFQGAHQSGGTGDSDDLLFRTDEREESADDSDPLAEGICEVEFYISSQSNPPALVRRLNRNLLASVQTTGTEEVLCRGVRNFSVEYFDGTTWQTSWDSTQLGDVLPYAVRVTIDVDNLPGATQSNGMPNVRRLSRTVPIACAKPVPTDSQ